MALTSICIVTWNNEETIGPCLKSIQTYLQSGTYEVLLVDNNSSDDTVEIVKQYPFVNGSKNNTNLFYAEANNQCLQEAKGDYILFLNPDTEFIEDSLQILLDFFKSKPKIGALTCSLQNQNGTLQRFCRRLPRISIELYQSLGFERKYPHCPVAAKHDYGGWDYTGDKKIEQAPGALLMMEAEFIKKIGGFDKKFPLLYNDVDLCSRIKNQGKKIWYTDKTTVFHVGGHSLKKTYPLTQRHLSEYKRKYFKRYFESFQNVIDLLSLPNDQPCELLHLKPDKKWLLVACTYQDHLIEILRSMFTFPGRNLHVLCKDTQTQFFESYSRIEKVHRMDQSFFQWSDIPTSTRNNLKELKPTTVIIPCANFDGHGYLNILEIASQLRPRFIVWINIQNQAFLINGNWLRKTRPGLIKIWGLSLYFFEKLIYKIKKSFL